MSAHLYIEGAESKEDQIRCREGFRRLLEKLGYSEQKRMPRLTACGGRNSTFDDFKTAHTAAKPGQFVAMLIDSEDPVANLEATWAHLNHCFPALRAPKEFSTPSSKSWGGVVAWNGVAPWMMRMSVLRNTSAS